MSNAEFDVQQFKQETRVAISVSSPLVENSNKRKYKEALWPIFHV